MGFLSRRAELMGVGIRSVLVVYFYGGTDVVWFVVTVL